MTARDDILTLLYTYAERIDAGDFDGLAELFEHAEITAVGLEGSRRGKDEVLQMYTEATRRYPDDGTPKTKHVMTNAIVEADEEKGEATARSYFTVLQAVPGQLALQAVVAGRYRDRFERVDGTWRFAHRHMIMDLLGDLSQHLLYEVS